MAREDDPFLSFNFEVKADNQVLGGFNEVSGLEIETDIEKFAEGGFNSYEQQLAGPSKYPSRLVLKRGMTNTQNLWSWYQDVLNGKIIRKTVSVCLLDSAGNEQRRWKFQDAVPVKWVGPQLRASSADVATETLELVHRGLIPS